MGSCPAERQPFYFTSFWNPHPDHFPAFTRFARSILHGMIGSFDNEDRRDLFKEVVNGSDLQGILDLGVEKGPMNRLYLIMILGGLMSLVFMICGIGIKLLGARHDPKQNRGKIARLAFYQVFLGFCTIWLFTVFSFNMNSLYSAVVKFDPMTGRAANAAAAMISDVKKQGNCEFEERVSKPLADLELAAVKYSGILKDQCVFNEIQRKMKNLKKEQEVLGELRNTAMNIMGQMKELREIIHDEEEKKNLEKVEDVIGIIWQDLLQLYQRYGLIISSTNQQFAGISKTTDYLSEKMNNVTNDFIENLNSIKERIRRSVNSFQNAFKEAGEWVEMVAWRMISAKRAMGKPDEIFEKLLLTEMTIGVASLIAVGSLFLCLFCLFVLSGFPHFIENNPEKSKRIRLNFFATFVLICLQVCSVAFCACAALYFAGPMRFACQNLYGTYYSESDWEPTAFYKEADLRIHYEEENGTIASKPFLEFFTCAHSGQKNLGPCQQDPKCGINIDEFMERMKNENQGFFEERFESQENILSDFLVSRAAILHMDISSLQRKNSSNLVDLVAKELNQFKEKLDSFSGDSLKEEFLDKCYSQNEQKEENEEIFARQMMIDHLDRFSEFKVAFSHVFDVSYLRTAYISSGRTFCADIGDPSQAIWLAAALLIFFLLADAVIIFKTSNLFQKDLSDLELADMMSGDANYAHLVSDSDSSRNDPLEM